METPNARARQVDVDDVPRSLAAPYAPARRPRDCAGLSSRESSDQRNWLVTKLFPKKSPVKELFPEEIPTLQKVAVVAVAVAGALLAVSAAAIYSNLM